MIEFKPTFFDDFISRKAKTRDELDYKKLLTQSYIAITVSIILLLSVFFVNYNSKNKYKQIENWIRFLLPIGAGISLFYAHKQNEKASEIETRYLAAEKASNDVYSNALSSAVGAQQILDNQYHLTSVNSLFKHENPVNENNNGNRKSLPQSDKDNINPIEDIDIDYKHFEEEETEYKLKDSIDWEQYPLVNPGNLMDELVDFETHIVFATKTRAGKSTFLKSLIYFISRRKKELGEKQPRFIIGDPKTTNWLNLHKIPNVVTYISGSSDEQLTKIQQISSQSYGILQNRINAVQKAIHQGLTPSDIISEFEDVYIILDEWFATYDKVNKSGTKFKNSIMGNLNDILAKGSELKIHLILVAQSHLSGEIGFSGAMKKSFIWIIGGRQGDKKDVGWESIKNAINGRSPLLEIKSEKMRMLESLEQAKEIASKLNNRPVAFVLKSEAEMFVLPDLSFIKDVSLVSIPDDNKTSAIDDCEDDDSNSDDDINEKIALHSSNIASLSNSKKEDDRKTNRNKSKKNLQAENNKENYFTIKEEDENLETENEESNDNVIMSPDLKSAIERQNQLLNKHKNKKNEEKEDNSVEQNSVNAKENNKNNMNKRNDMIIEPSTIQLIKDYYRNPNEYKKGLFYQRNKEANVQIFAYLKQLNKSKEEIIKACHGEIHISLYNQCEYIYNQMNYNYDSQSAINDFCLSNPSVSWDDRLLLPTEPGVYYFYKKDDDNNCTLFYVGVTKRGKNGKDTSIKLRINSQKYEHQHFKRMNSLNKQYPVYIGRIIIQDLKERIETESQLIQIFKPSWQNVQF